MTVNATANNVLDMPAIIQSRKHKFLLFNELIPIPHQSDLTI
jgi:hypothetical protein